MDPNEVLSRTRWFGVSWRPPADGTGLAVSCPDMN